MIQCYVNQYTIYVQIFEGCIVFFEIFMVNYIHLQSLKFNWQNFGLHWLESRIHVNSYIWHLQGIMASVNHTSCSGEVVVARLATSLRPTTLFNPFHMTPIVNCDIPEGNFVHISHQTRDNSGCFDKQTLSLDWTSLAVMSHVQHALTPSKLIYLKKLYVYTIYYTHTVLQLECWDSNSASTRIG